MDDDVTAKTLERFRVREVLERYSDGITRQDWEAVASVYAEDAKFEELPPLTLKFSGRKEIVENVRYAVERMHLLVFMLHSCVVELDGDRARSKSLIHEYGFLDKTEDSRIEIFGVYDDELVKQNGNWQFMNRVFRPIWCKIPAETMTEIVR